MKKVILDVDTGIDDALAIAYLVSQDVEVLGITTGFGNVYDIQAYENTRNLLTLLNREDIPVFKGSSCPLLDKEWVRPEINKRIHGENGVGNVTLPTSNAPHTQLMAWEFMVESARKYGKELTIITVGALTNAVKALQMDEEAMKSIKEYVVMGGAIMVRGNCNHYAEANFLRDPVSTKIFMEQDLPIVMVGLDVTLRTVVKQCDLNKWKTKDNALSKALCDMTTYYYTNEGDSSEEMCGCLHDPMAIEVALNPDIIESSFNCNLFIENEGEDIGRCVVHHDRLLHPTNTTKVCLKCDSDTFKAKFIQSIFEIM